LCAAVFFFSFFAIARSARGDGDRSNLTDFLLQLMDLRRSGFYGLSSVELAHDLTATSNNFS
jgi:hypothetical protein